MSSSLRPRRRLAIRRTAAALAAFCLVASSPHALAQQEARWEHMGSEDGIEVWRLDVPDKDLPGFRGETIIPASLRQIVDVMLDESKHTEWMHRCEESTVLAHLGGTRAIIYTRVDAPWPVWDRDAVLETSARYNESHTWVRMAFRTVKDSERYRPVPQRVVRMPWVKGSYELRQLDENRTRIRYQVESDIGGSIPDFIAVMVAKELPYRTLSQLRARVMHVTGQSKDAR